MEKYNKYHESLEIDCCDKNKSKPKVNNYCCGGINLPSHDNEIEVLIRQLKREVKELLKTTEARLLCQDKKIAETMVYIKNNLSNAIRNLLDSMLKSGQLEDIITDTVLDNIDEMKSDIKDLQDYNTKYFVIFGDSWSDFNGGFENWYEKASIGNVLNCELINFAVGGAGFIVNDNLISEQITNANNTLTDFQKEHTKYVVIEGGVNDMGTEIFSTNDWNLAVTNAIETVHTIFPNAEIVYAPNMCSPDLNGDRSATCVYEGLNYISHHLPYRNCNVKAPRNLPYFWLGHRANEVFTSDNLHLNLYGAYAFGKEVLNAFTGSSSDMVYRHKLSNANNINVLLNSNGNMELHGTYYASDTSNTVIDSNSKLSEYIIIFSKLMPNRLFIGCNGSANSIAWINYLGGNNKELALKGNSADLYYF